MRLSKIKLAGFKSFVDPTSLQLGSDLVAVVGPNGCGKSNVIDAVRWVMGESSAKHLRGDSMTDVIFNGSATRKPVGTASVELVFDNSDGTIGGEYAKYAEISVKRTVSRDGQSIYSLNGTRCRRRDITDIFLGTGLGPRSYSIIEQGMISRVIEAKPEELRVFLEEAAGISRYKERRRETENRIRHTRENLDRLNDLRDELEKQLQHLQRQARTAERYKEYKEEERRLKAELLAIRLRDLDRQMEERDRRVAEAETALEAVVADQRALEAELERERAAHVEAQEGFNQVQARHYAVGADLARVEQAIQHGRERHRQQQEDLERARRSLADLQHHLEQDRAQLAALREGLAAREPELELLRRAEGASAALREEAEGRMRGWQEQWEAFNQRAARPAQQAQVERTRIEQLERQTIQMESRRTRLGETLAMMDSTSLDEEIARLEEEEALQAEAVSQAQEGVEQLLEAVREAREEVRSLHDQVDQARGELQRRRGRLASLEALQQAALGNAAGSQVVQWLEKRGLAELPRLAQRIRVAEGWEGAAEMVLGHALEAVCVERLEGAARDLAGFDRGSLSLVDGGGPASPWRPREGWVPLLEQVESPVEVSGLLAGVYCAESLEEALAKRETLAAGESLVTREGVWVGPGWLRLVRESDEKAGILAREQEIRKLHEEIERRLAESEALAERMAAARERVHLLEGQRDEAQQALHRAHRAHADLRTRLDVRRNRKGQVEADRERLEKELAELSEQTGRIDQEVAEARALQARALEEMEELARERELLQAEREQLAAALEQAREQARRDRDRAHELALQVESMRSRETSLAQSLERMERQSEEMNRRVEELEGALEEAMAPQEALRQELETLLEKRQEVDREMATARGRLEELDARLRELEQNRNRLDQRARERRDALEQQRMARRELEIRRATLAEQLAEIGLELEALLAALPAEAREGEWQERVERIARRIQRLGPINLAAIEEYEQQAERKRYIDSQHADVTEALETLENAIRKIDRETRTRFKDVFDRVNAGIKELFPRLFGGGHAYLELTEEDLLSAGVTVMARPPGKRNSSIHLLSGGEKALTAVALVFSIFRLNPAPFCMLDEVDAPLDDANVGRFCDLVREMSEKVQFIFITHNKQTMAIAEQLSGVTMHEPGVSRLVAVDVEEAVRMVVG